MIKATGIDSLTNFQKNAKAMTAELEASKEPMVLTVNGKAKLVVQDACAYQAMIDELEKQRLLEAIRKGMEEIDAGLGIPVDEAFARMKAKYGL